MRFKSLTNDQTVPRYRYFNFYKPHKVDGKGFSSQMPTLKTDPSDQKSNRRTCAEECQMPFKLYLNIISGEDSSPSVEFTINPVLVYLPPHAYDVAFPEGQLPDKLRSNSMKSSSIYNKNIHNRI